MVTFKTCCFLFSVLGLLATVCFSAPVEVGRSPISSVTKTLKLVRTYTNPFVWIGTPTLPRWTNRRRDQVVRKPARKRYRWAIEVDANNRWWLAVYENDPNNPLSTTGKRTVWQF